MQARLHDKYFIVDDKMYLLGGRNTANLFLGDYSSKKNIDRELIKDGTRVDIITNAVSSGANPWGCTDYLNQKKSIWKTGAKVYEFMGKYSCHTKAPLIDDHMTILGSYNMDMRSTYQDTELMLAVDSAELNKEIAKEIETDKTYSRTMGEDETYVYGEYYKEKEMSTGKKIFYAVLRVVTIPIQRFL